MFVQTKMKTKLYTKKWKRQIKVDFFNQDAHRTHAILTDYIGEVIKTSTLMN